MTAKFYSTKQVWIELGLTSEKTLHYRVSKGLYPPFQKSPYRKNGVGYCETVISFVRQIVVKKGRPAKNKS